MLKSFLAVLVLIFGVLSTGALGQEKAFPKDLAQYIRDARKAGLKDDQIQAKAIQAGWSAAAVTEAIKQASSEQTTPKPESAPGNGWEPVGNLTSPAAIAQPWTINSATPSATTLVSAPTA